MHNQKPQLHNPPLQNLEVESLVGELQSFLDSKLQKVFATDDSVGFELYKNSKIYYLWMYLDQKNPSILCFDKIPRAFHIKKTTPILLFLRAHAEGKRVSEIVHKKEYGRVLEIHLGYDEPLKIEVRLFPHGANILVYFANKKISMHRPKDLVLSTTGKETGEKDLNIHGSVRTLKSITSQWLEMREKQTKLPDSSAVKNKLLEKKLKSLQKIEGQIESLNIDNWKVTGDFLKMNQTLDVPDHLKKYVDVKKKLSENIQTCFEKSKKNKEKFLGATARRAALLDEIKKIETSKEPGSPSKGKPSKPKEHQNWGGYRIELDGKTEAFVGKNAKENLEILRFAQSWDYWLHLKDYPGAHGIIRRPRNHVITNEDFRKVALFIAEKSRKSFHHIKPGDSFEVLIVERRFVRPIKGDKLGRVTYSDERVLLCRMK